MGTFEGATDIVNSPMVRGRLIHLSCSNYEKQFILAEAGSFL